MKKKLAALLAALMLFNCAGGALAAESTPVPDDPQQTQSIPFPGGINVNLNGKYLAFDGVAPITVDGNTMVPFRAFLESFGAEVGFADGKTTAKFNDGGLMELSAQSSEMKFTQGGKTEIVNLGVPPYVMNRTTYLPARPVGEALGLEVTWDSNAKTVYLTDWAATTAQIDTHFKLFNELCAASTVASKAAYDVTKPLDAKINMALTGDFDIEGVKAKGDVSLAIGALMDKSGISMQMTPKLNLKEFAQLAGEDAAAVGDIFTAVDGSSIQAIINQGTGDLYIKTDLASKIGLAMDKDTWYHSKTTQAYIAGADDLVGLYEEMLGGDQMTIGSVLVGYSQILGQITGLNMGSPYEQAILLSDFMRLLYGDDVMTKSESGGVTTYRVDMDTVKIAAQAVKLGLTDNATLKDLMGADIPDISIKLTATVKDQKLTNITMNMGIKMTGETPVDIAVFVTGDAKKMTMTMDMAVKDGKDTAAVGLKMDFQCVQSTKTAPTAPPKGEKIEEAE